MRMSNEISKMIENANAVILVIRRDVESGRLTATDEAKAMQAVSKAMGTIIKCVESQRQIWKDRQRRHRTEPSKAGRIL